MARRRKRRTRSKLKDTLMPNKLRDCSICAEPVVDRPFQDRSARTCSPRCAQRLAIQEHPELDLARDKRERKLARLFDN